MFDKSFIGVLKKRMFRLRGAKLLVWDRAQAWLDKPRKYRRNQENFRERVVEDGSSLLPLGIIGSLIQVPDPTGIQEMAPEDGESSFSEINMKRKMDDAGSKTRQKNNTGEKNKIYSQSLKDKDIEIRRLRNELKENEALLESANGTILTTQLAKENLLSMVQNQAKEIIILQKRNQKLHEERDNLKSIALAKEAFDTADIVRVVSDYPPPKNAGPKAPPQLIEDETCTIVSLTKLVPKNTNAVLERNMNDSDIEDMRLVLEMDEDDEDTEDDTLLHSLLSPLRITCPLCSVPFLTKEQEQHASSCQGVEDLLLLELQGQEEEHEEVQEIVQEEVQEIVQMRDEVREIVQMQEEVQEIVHIHEEVQDIVHIHEEVQEIVHMQEHVEDIQDIIQILRQEDVRDIVLEQEEVQHIEQIQEHGVEETAHDKKELLLKNQEVQEVVVQEMEGGKSLKRVRFSFEAIELAESPGRKSREELHLLARRNSVRQTGY